MRTESRSSEKPDFLLKNHPFRKLRTHFSARVPNFKRIDLSPNLNIFWPDLVENDRVSLKFMGKLTDLKNIVARRRNRKIKKNVNKFCGNPVRT